MNESKKHIILKKLIIEKIGNSDSSVLILEEFKIDNKRYDVGIMDKASGKLLTVIECIVSQRIGEVFDKLIRLDLDITKIVVRFKKKRNPLANKIIEKAQALGIQLIEF